ncbi:MAG: hypothetical protein Ct9H300mP32_5780 [Verrucomicrobiota bacterium]|nr:MAG: hypothetical protein Ct9H300mP32_5780 [Verrucomicrobiota bacterium]
MERLYKLVNSASDKDGSVLTRAGVNLSSYRTATPKTSPFGEMIDCPASV